MSDEVSNRDNCLYGFFCLKKDLKKKILISYVPIYWGASNITKHIPANTFIDKRNFKTYEELYYYLKNIPIKEYRNYLNAIINFIKGDEIYPFSAEYFAYVLCKEIIRC